MENQTVFLESVSVGEFLQMMGAQGCYISPSPRGNRLLLCCTQTTDPNSKEMECALVSNKLQEEFSKLPKGSNIDLSTCMVSRVQAPDGEVYLSLHKAAELNREVMFTVTL